MRYYITSMMLRPLHFQDNAHLNAQDLLRNIAPTLPVCIVNQCPIFSHRLPFPPFELRARSVGIPGVLLQIVLQELPTVD